MVLARSDTGVLANTEHFSAWEKEFAPSQYKKEQEAGTQQAMLESKCGRCSTLRYAQLSAKAGHVVGGISG